MNESRIVRRLIKQNRARIVAATVSDAERASRERGVSRGGSPLAGTIFTEAPAPSDCATCGKTGKKLEELQLNEWECSHVDCQKRGRCWSSGTPSAARQPAPDTDAFAPLFDKVEA